MTEDILTVDKSASIGDAAKIMEVNGVRRIPVIEKTENGRDRCIGMVSLDDLVASESVGTNLLSRIVKTQILRRFQNVRAPYTDENHIEQTFNRFNKTMAAKMNVPKATAERITFHLLKELVRRLPYTEAAHFIAQLPSLIHEDLFNLPAGPDLNVNEESIVKDLMKGFQLNRTDALDVAKHFWAGLEAVMDPIILDHVLDQFPADMRGILSDKEIAGEPLLVEYVVTREKFQLEEMV